jgi:hypothetical protein
MSFFVTFPNEGFSGDTPRVCEYAGLGSGSSRGSAVTNMSAYV